MRESWCDRDAARRPGGSTRPVGARVAFLLALGLAGLAAARGALSEPVRDTLPFRLAFGRPGITSGDDVACYLWIQGGRLRLRLTADGKAHRVAGELRTGGGGTIEDVTPLSENLLVHQPRPGKLAFEVRMANDEEGFDVTPGGAFSQLTVDLEIDGERRPAALRIGEQRRSPAALPARLDLRNADSSWLERFGF